MLPPDEYAIRALDALVQWLHDWGVDRVSTMRAIGVIAALTSTWDAFSAPGAGWFTAILSALIVLMILFLVWAQEVRSKSRFFNYQQLAQREGVQAWVRFIMWSYLFFFVLFVDLDSALATIIYISFFYFTHTLKPIDDPKHHWRELFSRPAEAM